MKYEYIIIGAGPAGIQLGYFFQQHNYNYLILDKSKYPGSFFQKYPRHGKLLSINKRYTGKTNDDFNLRHDWNSLLCHDYAEFNMKKFSQEFYPSSNDYFKYLQAFTSRYQLKIKYQQEVKTISKKKSLFIIQCDKVKYTCKKVIIATGLFKPVIPNFKGNATNLILGYENMPMDKKFYQDKKVLIIGGGNSAFETANYLLDVTQIVHLATLRGSPKFAWNTHFAGDLRTVNAEFIDTYYLKSLNGIIPHLESHTNINGEVTTPTVHFIKKGKQILALPSDDIGNLDEDTLHFAANLLHIKNNPIMDQQMIHFIYDIVIRCTGFTFDNSIFNLPCVPEMFNDKLPKIKSNFESVNVPNMFFAGVLTQSLDYKKSSGSFIHGFRYNCLALFNYLQYKYQQTDWPHLIFDNHEELVTYMIHRINTTSALYQMFSSLLDLLVFHNNKYIYYFELPKKYLSLFCQEHQYEMYFTISLEYGGRFSHNAFDENRFEIDPNKAHLSKFLHPIFRFYYNYMQTGELHFLEDFFVEWNSYDLHHIPLSDFILYCIDNKKYPTPNNYNENIATLINSVILYFIIKFQ